MTDFRDLGECNAGPDRVAANRSAASRELQQQRSDTVFTRITQPEINSAFPANPVQPIRDGAAILISPHATPIPDVTTMAGIKYQLAINAKNGEIANTTIKASATLTQITKSVNEYRPQLSLNSGHHVRSGPTSYNALAPVGGRQVSTSLRL